MPGESARNSGGSGRAFCSAPCWGVWGGHWAAPSESAWKSDYRERAAAQRPAVPTLALAWPAGSGDALLPPSPCRAFGPVPRSGPFTLPDHPFQASSGARCLHAASLLGQQSTGRTPSATSKTSRVVRRVGSLFPAQARTMKNSARPLLQARLRCRCGVSPKHMCRLSSVGCPASLGAGPDTSSPLTALARLALFVRTAIWGVLPPGLLTRICNSALPTVSSARCLLFAQSHEIWSSLYQYH